MSIGIRPPLVRPGISVVVGLLLVIAATADAEPDHVSARQEVRSYALLKGTVFTNLGRSFPGVDIRLERADIEEKDRKKSRQEARSDRIGEFAFRVSPGPAKYELTFRAKNFEIEKREIEVVANERVALTVLLHPEG